MEKEYFTGRTGRLHQIASEHGVDYIVYVLDNGEKEAIVDILENQELIEWVINEMPDLAEWTRVRAFSEKDALDHVYIAHAQYYNKLNGVPNWQDTTEIVD